MRDLLLHPFRWASISLALEAAAALVLHGTGIDGLQALARYSGRMGLVWFALVFCVTPWHRLAPSDTTRLALRRRRRLGLAFGYHHFVHLGLLLTYLAASRVQFEPARAAGGMIGYLFLALLMLTSSDAAVARLGPRNWSRLHRTGIWYLWIAFLMTYVGRFRGEVDNPGGGPAEWAVSIGLVVAMAALRLASRRAGAQPA